MTITATDDIVAGNAATVVGIETVNFTIQAFVTTAGVNTTFDVDSSGVTADNINLDLDQNGTSIVDATITGVATGTTVTASDDFTGAVIVSGDDNASVVVTTA
ncbi:MAG: hypothetical protein JJ868_19555, partial [Shimia sp.]|uniref:hypothetical protein n=1 Tax=Shimia sp. TaxID=1954381 RepID=UPI001B2138C8